MDEVRCRQGHARTPSRADRGRHTVREGKKYTNRIDAVRAAGETVRAVLTNGRGGLSGDEMALLPHLEIVRRQRRL